jgi:hypothetical protein
MLMAGSTGCAACDAQMGLHGVMPNPGGSAPGYAVAGGPEPVGVMRAGYQTSTGAPGHAVVGGDPSAFASPGPSFVGANSSRRPHVVAHLFGLPTPGSMWEERKEQARRSHAAIPYGPNGQPVTELPASVVFGK